MLKRPGMRSGDGRSGSSATPQSLAKESQLETEPAPILAFQIPCVIPPLRLKIRMAEIIARELVPVAGYRGAIRGIALDDGGLRPRRLLRQRSNAGDQHTEN